MALICNRFLQRHLEGCRKVFPNLRMFSFASKIIDKFSRHSILGKICIKVNMNLVKENLRNLSVSITIDFVSAVM